ncbi:MAG TPA: anaerobic ribonucleoside-triphosphate reductase activating protein [Syntrophorhabdales bacterium]|nr:anaerobic ribonucleoside-triphosphate reductase activating protein [Syntrophorhabdales bacterium]
MSAGHNFPVKGFIETSFLDWKDHLSSVFFTGGCNFRCPFCHNSDLVLNHERLLDIPEEQILGNLRKFRKWVDRVVITGGEPTLQKGLPAFVELLKREGYKVKLDTNGSHPEVIKDLVKAGFVDYIAMDIKGPIAAYDRWCGTTVDRDKIEESIDFVIGGEIDHEFRMTVVPFLHKEADVYEAASRVGNAKRFTVQDFVPRNTLNPAFLSVKSFSPDRMSKIRQNVEGIMQDAKVRCTLHQ